jgi:hypothetical protein
MTARLKKAELTPRLCGTCSVEFTPMRRSKGLYCSNRCANAGNSRASTGKRGDAQRGRGDGLTYRKRDGRHEHRVIAEAKLGRGLRPGEVVHHIDGNKLNNDPENLAVMTQAEHMREHGLGIPGMALPWEPWKARWAR